MSDEKVILGSLVHPKKQDKTILITSSDTKCDNCKYHTRLINACKLFCDDDCFNSEEHFNNHHSRSHDFCYRCKLNLHNNSQACISICNNFLKGRCKNGDNCHFIHVNFVELIHMYKENNKILNELRNKLCQDEIKKENDLLELLNLPPNWR